MLHASISLSTDKFLTHTVGVGGGNDSGAQVTQ